MKPHKLQLIGFHGIQSAKGRDEFSINFNQIPNSARLVAITGPNGAAKTTIIDNMHPYRVMPSHSKTLGPGGFSYWDHIYLPQSKKLLEWEHQGLHYRSSFVFRMTGKTKKAEYFLEELQGTEWVAVTSPEGITSDGKAETYDICIDSILGTPETFFTSNYSAQRKKSISDYAVSDFKSILANILNLEYLKRLSEKANTVSRMLLFHLETLQGEISIGRQAQINLDQVSAEIAVSETNLQKSAEAEIAIQLEISAISEQSAILNEKLRADAAKEDQRKFLQVEIEKLNLQAVARRTELTHQFGKDESRLQTDLAATKEELLTAQKDRALENEELTQIKVIIDRREEILQSKKQCAELTLELEGLDREIRQGEESISALPSLRSEVQKEQLNLANLTTNGQSRKSTLLAMIKTGKLANEVPCANTTLQPLCPLLKEALAAQSEIPAKRTEIDFLWNEAELTKLRISERTTELEKLVAIETKVANFQKSRQTIQNSIARHSVVAAQEQLLENALLRYESVEKAISARTIRIDYLFAKTKAIEADFQSLKEQHQNRLTDAAAQFVDQTKVLQQQLETIGPAVTNDQVLKQAELLKAKQKQGESAAFRTLEQRNAMVVLLSKRTAMEELISKSKKTAQEAERISIEISKFKLLEKGLGNDGLIALSIDDAGPEISALCNDLFKACFDSRFSIRMETQKETHSGNLRETFKILVFDNHRGNEKDLDFVSGGENVWINEALIRAIALYKGQCSGVQYETLFSDESDGPLDPEKKRKYMAIKRYVLERGGYAREFFITQTPEIWEMADYILDVTTL